MSDANAPTLLVVEDDPITRLFLAENLSVDGWDVVEASSLQDALRLVEQVAPQLVLTDLTLPDGSGLDLVAYVRAADGIAARVDPDTPILVLSGLDGELDRLRGFERGCDDYLVKPFSYPELRLRITALLRRARQRPREGRIRIGELTIDPVRRVVAVGGAPVDLTQKEYAVLQCLAREPTRVFTKRELLRTIWGYRGEHDITRTIDSHACRLRRKLAVGGHAFVVNVWGVGYRLVDASPDASPAPGVGALHAEVVA
ncbi:MAG: response regulator transcription factor [Solirubrobacteraceae bacterium]|nr:response regulator transcription factor [Solirubrobacteraceae bacterium]